MDDKKVCSFAVGVARKSISFSTQIARNQALSFARALLCRQVNMQAHMEKLSFQLAELTELTRQMSAQQAGGGKCLDRYF